MAAENQIQQIEVWVNEMLSTEPAFFLVSVKIKPTNNVKVFIDGDNGLSIENCVRFNRKLYKIIEESDLYPSGDFSLELSSPGLDQPLILHRQYIKNIGREIEVLFNDGSKKQGKLMQVTGSDIIIEQVTGKGKKMVTEQSVIPINNIKTITVQIKF